ncbi:hypothetical protein CJP74_06515 [Psittacicella melopsittaci]|uniref:DUF1043 family protein n=1 Tax=Psittacicella melopsittaci TaxID=2028576 RepID=A0A3A1Y2S5_9GAMM|nr:DUF1043 family protein [Psittacicella melopsittaci]RIY31720.1 hypothetical protein CJP74_06515 [Psittacicella melopsittaci]
MNTTVLIIVLFLLGVVVGYFLARFSSSDQKRVQELKSELTNARKAQQESLQQVNSAIQGVQTLAQSMAVTYRSLEATKAALEGRDFSENNYLLQIKNGKLERLAYDLDVDVEAQEPAEQKELAEQKEPAEPATPVEDKSAPEAEEKK